MVVAMVLKNCWLKTQIRKVGARWTTLSRVSTLPLRSTCPNPKSTLYISTSESRKKLFKPTNESSKGSKIKILISSVSSNISPKTLRIPPLTFHTLTQKTSIPFPVNPINQFSPILMIVYLTAVYSQIQIQSSTTFQRQIPSISLKNNPTSLSSTFLTVKTFKNNPIITKIQNWNHLVESVPLYSKKLIFLSLKKFNFSKK